MIELEKVTDVVVNVANKAVNATDKAISHGRSIIEKAALMKRHERALGQLGALVYSLHKRKEENTLLVNRYMESIERIEERIKECDADVSFSAKVEECPHCGQRLVKNAVFCRACGERLQ